ARPGGGGGAGGGGAPPPPRRRGGRPPPRLPPAVGLSVYRIVQEALANVVRHAPGAAAWVSLAVAGESLLVTVVNAAPPVRAESLEASAEGTGHGLAGMRERVRLLDGRLDTGPLPDGGFKVAAVLPLTALTDTRSQDSRPDGAAPGEPDGPPAAS
ncbi:ATP-binding protein, partial [Kitasatospora sp. NPDC059463]|uniref:ATP-binding protein n=1 Tax=Kitasatospora sp. NPDC059463 TaxID=3346842 RepID=UPI0036A9B581